MFLTVVIPTLGRDAELVKVLESLEPEMTLEVEVIIIDQNPQGFLEKVIPSALREKVVIHRVEEKGLSKAKNTGLKLASGQYINFCDDDAVVEPGLLAMIKAGFEKYSDAAMIAFRVFDLDEDIPCMMPFPEQDCTINTRNFHSITIEFAQIWVTERLKVLDGYDPTMGVGSPYGADEGKDLLARALDARQPMFYIAKTGFRHPSKQSANPDRYFSYAQGTAAFAYKHWRKPYALKHVAMFLLKSLAGVIIFNIWKAKESQRYWMRFAGFCSGIINKIKE